MSLLFLPNCFKFHSISFFPVDWICFLSSPSSLWALLLLSFSSSQHRQPFFQFRPQLLPAPQVWQSQRRAAARLHQERLGAFDLLTMWPRLVFFWTSATRLPKPLPSGAIKRHLRSSHATDWSQLWDRSPCSHPQPTGLRWGPITQGKSTFKKKHYKQRKCHLHICRLFSGPARRTPSTEKPPPPLPSQITGHPRALALPDPQPLAMASLSSNAR